MLKLARWVLHICATHNPPCIDLTFLNKMVSNPFEYFSCAAIPCPSDGQGSNGAGGCSPCPAGTYGSNLNAAQPCQPCNATAQSFSGPGAANCSMCGANFTANANHTGCGERKNRMGIAPVWRHI